MFKLLYKKEDNKRIGKLEKRLEEFEKRLEELEEMLKFYYDPRSESGRMASCFSLYMLPSLPLKTVVRKIIDHIGLEFTETPATQKEVNLVKKKAKKKKS